MNDELSRIRSMAWKRLQEDGRLPEGWRLQAQSFVSELREDQLRSIAETWLMEYLLHRDRMITLEDERASLPMPETTKPVALFVTPLRATPLSETILARVRDIAAATATDLAAEWSPDLLTQTIRLRDGRETTWGAATLDEHRERLAMFTANAAANLEGAARHRKAIDDIERGRVTNLNELSLRVAS